jgi:hypothetical protein
MREGVEVVRTHFGITGIALADTGEPGNTPGEDRGIVGDLEGR